MQQTQFGSLDNHRKGTIEVIKGQASHYVMSNVFEVASHSAPYEKVIVGKNLKYVIETLRAEGVSPWFTASHDEFVVALDGEIDVHFIKPSDGALVSAEIEGTVKLEGEPSGQKMGFVRLRRGHQALLPAGAAYRFEARKTGVLLVQTIAGAESVEKWADICIQ
ncbi:cupin domain-containing protein [Caballeronia glebae]|uniref:hydroxyquinol 1,2-dioxygenase n=1 Tax=Caballeronia glebae TaxID=1777143 RepID=UPI0038BD9535